MPITPGRAVSGELLGLGEQDVVEIEVEGFSILQISATHANTDCRVWLRLLDIDSTELGRAAVPRGGSGTVTALVAATSRVLVVVDSGPLSLCAGARYELTPRVLPLRVAGLRGPERAATRAASDYYDCLTWSKRAENLSIKIERTRHALLTATGPKRRALRAKLNRLQDEYRKAMRRLRRYC